MKCREFELAWVGDDESLRSAAGAHAAGCARCAEVVRADREILEQAAAWKRSAVAPPAGLERRIAAGLSADGWIEETAETASSRPKSRGPVWIWAAVAAVVIFGITILARPELFQSEVGSSEIGASEVEHYEEAIAEVNSAQKSYIKAIAELERRAAPVLARSEDPELSSREAALLLNHRDRLAHLDSVIAEVQTFLDEHPGHARGHTVLLAAYVEKDGLLREILEFSSGEKS